MSSSNKVVVLTILLAVGFLLWKDKLVEHQVESFDDFIAMIAPKNEAMSTITGSSSSLEVNDSGTEQLNTQVTRVTLLERDYWEAKVEVEYSQGTELPSGYVTLDMVDVGWHHNVGMPSRPGKRIGVALLSRHLGRPGEYTSHTLRGRIYNPYKADRDYFSQSFPVTISWPGKEDSFSRQTPLPEFSGIRVVRVFRNIPNYSGFATSLVENGFSPDKIELNLGVCGGCTPSLIVGEGVPVTAIQNILVTLKKHGYPIDLFELSSRPEDVGTIQIGQIPGALAKPSWSKFSELVQPGISDKDFFSIIGFAPRSNYERAVELHAKAKQWIDNSSYDQMSPAQGLLLQAMELQPDYIPSYLELSRYYMRSDPSFSEWGPTKTSAKALRVLQQAKNIDPDNPNVYVLLGYVQTIEKQYPAAKRSFDKAESLNSKNLWLNNNRALWFQHYGDSKLAAQEWSKTLKAKRDGTDNDRALSFAMGRLAEHHISLGNHRQALSIYERSMNEFPETIPYVLSYARLLLSNSRKYDEAASVIDKGIRGNCWCSGELRAMKELMIAGIAYKKGESVVHNIVKAGASYADLDRVVVNIAQGEQGRSLIQPLMKKELRVKDIEAEYSILRHVDYQEDNQLLEFLLTNGADPNLPQNIEGMTPLMFAILSNSEASARTLIRYGADPFREDISGNNSFTYAESIGNSRLISVLNKGTVTYY